MKSKSKMVLAVLVAMLVLGSAATAAQAATEGPFYKVSGARLGSGETKTLTANPREGFFVVPGLIGVTIECTGMSVASGAKIVGSAGANSSTSEETMVFTNCTQTGGGSECQVENGVITTALLKGTLGYATATRSGRLLEFLKPATGKVFANIVFEGAGCKFINLAMEGSLIGSLSGGKKPIEVGVNETQGKARELIFKQTPVKELWTESAGVLTKTSASLTVAGSRASIEATFNLGLGSAPEWGFFT